MSIIYASIASPLGPIQASLSDQGIHQLLFREQAEQITTNPKHPLLEKLRAQLAEYFNGQRHQFDLPLAAKGTAFQQRVWAELCRIPYGETWSYVQLAQAIGQPTASRAVGMTNGRNPICLLVPCHRVIGKNGQLTGYAGGLERKAWLLEHERSHR